MRRNLCLAFLVLGMLTASDAFGQDAAGTAKGTGTSSAPQAAPAEKPMRIRVGGNVASAKITHMVQPAYPQAAKDANISGTVVLHCIIAKDGTMTQVEFVSGPPLLIKPAIYVAALMRDFYIAGGRVMVREFAEARELMSLRENLIFNCTGLGARTLFHDEELPCVWNAIAIVSMWLF